MSDASHDFPEGKKKQIIHFVAKAGMVDLDRLVDRFFREEHETLLDARPRAEAFLKRLCLKGFLNARPVVLDGLKASTSGDPVKHLGSHYFTRAYCLTPRTSWEWSLPLPPNLRTNFVTHHLKTLDAIVQVEKDIFWSGEGRVVEFKMESELVRESFAGKRFYDAKTSEALGKYPDALLIVERPDGTREEVRVEYVSAKYSDKMIAEKAAAWTTGRTIWAVPNHSTAARVERLTGAPALHV
ncbi:hypothetical protein NVS55_40180 (plasmid) [Myxococcus stipitatus]|uniref:hypothetical protein n=1 Tax=Myxococcus stipitatus TaxID=83455 RepID=UPI00314548DF